MQYDTLLQYNLIFHMKYIYTYIYIYIEVILVGLLEDPENIGFLDSCSHLSTFNC